jgi:aryl-alcohol dehydrogenase-like predicted oxidoreductase
MKIVVDTRSGAFLHNAAPADLIATTAWALQQLDTPYIDTAVLNREDAVVPLEQSVACLQELVKQGKYRAVGRAWLFAHSVPVYRACPLPHCLLILCW